jgi:hypothetical protein
MLHDRGALVGVGSVCKLASLERVPNLSLSRSRRFDQFRSQHRATRADKVNAIGPKLEMRSAILELPD